MKIRELTAPKYVVLEKERGETPLMAIGRWKGEHPQWADLPASYAGRLDPMASGKLLMLLGDECKRQDSYIGLDKEYVIEVALGISTDTGDVLGLLDDKTFEVPSSSGGTRSSILSQEIGSHSRTYPVFSSKTVNGKPLFLYALENRLNEIEIPEHIETIYKIKLLKTQMISKSDLQQRINEALAVVPRSDEPSKALGADFRQDEIRGRWKTLFEEMPDYEFEIWTLRVTCGSGAYMRTFAERVGKSLGTQALALSIHRTKIGTYSHFGPLKWQLGFWSQCYD